MTEFITIILIAIFVSLLYIIYSFKRLVNNMLVQKRDDLMGGKLRQELVAPINPLKQRKKFHYFDHIVYVRSAESTVSIYWKRKRCCIGFSNNTSGHYIVRIWILLQL